MTALFAVSRSPWRQALPPVAAVGAGLALGLISVVFSPLFALLFLAGCAAAVIAVRAPEIAILGLLLMTSTVVDESAIPGLPLGVGTIYPYDIILPLMVLLLVRVLAERQFKFRLSGAGVPLLAFYTLAFLSTILAIQESRTTLALALGPIRVLNGYLVFFAVAGLVRTRRQLLVLWEGTLALATLVAVAMIAQYLLGSRVQLLPGRVEALVTGQTLYTGVTRILPPGQSLVAVGLVAVVSIVATGGSAHRTWARVFQAGVLALALVLTFNRHLWLGAGLSIVCLTLLVDRSSRQRLARWLAVALLLMAGLAPILAMVPESAPSRLVSAGYQRLLTMASPETFEESSLGFRAIEYSYAIPQVLSRPVTGLGLGFNYRPYDSRLDTPQRPLRNYIHNGHLTVLLAAGLPAYLFLLWASVSFVASALARRRTRGDSYLRGIVLGTGVAYVCVVMVGSMTSPILLEPHWTPVLGLMMGSAAAVSVIGAE